MKKIMLLLTLSTMAVSPLQANAGHTSRTTAIGVAGGALIGHAIGRDTEAVLIGTAIGGVAGYMVGNEMDKKDAVHVRTYRVVEPYYPRRHYGYEKRCNVVIQNITYRPVVHKKKKRKKHGHRHRYNDYHPRWERMTVW